MIIAGLDTRKTDTQSLFLPRLSLFFPSIRPPPTDTFTHEGTYEHRTSEGETDLLDDK